MNILPKKSVLAGKAAKSAANFFNKAAEKFKKSTALAEKAVTSNNVKAEKLSKETKEMELLQVNNAIAINNLEKFFTQPISVEKDLTKDEKKNNPA